MIKAAGSCEMSVHARLGGIRNVEGCVTFIVTVGDNLKSHAESEGHCVLRYCLKIGQQASPINDLKQHFITQLSQTCGLHLVFNPLNAKLNPICHLLALLEAHHILHVSRIRVNVF